MDKSKAYIKAIRFLTANAEGLGLESGHEIDIVSKLESRVELQEIAKAFGIEIDNPSLSPDWIEINRHTHISRFGKGSVRSIAAPDKNKQPVNELLYQIRFPTGSYVFGDSYPEELFKAFFEEFKSYKPKYIDSANKCLYFCTDNAKHVHRDYDEIFNKYAGKAAKLIKAEKADALRAELRRLEA